METWLTLVTALPTENATLRQRAWRALRAAGAAVLRDGVYLMPERADCRSMLEKLAADLNGGGTAYLLRVEPTGGADFKALFDRGQDFTALLADIDACRQALGADTAEGAMRQARKLRKSFAALSATDFFPGEAQRQTEAALQALELAGARVLSPDEPHAQAGEVPRLRRADYQGRTWATRRRPWVDRLASAWLIRRFIDPAARLLWLETPADCPADALGFDFDGATFSHIGHRVTFEVLTASFGLEPPALARLGRLVHCLDVGGVQPPEAAGIESVLAGMRSAIADDDALLAAAGTVLDGLLSSFERGPAAPE
jgi:hypothetical protein